MSSSLLYSRYWKDAAEVSGEMLGALLRRGLVVSVEVDSAPDDSISCVVLEIHHQGEPPRFIRLGASGIHTEGWIWAEAK